MADEIKKVEIKLYFPSDLVLSEKQYDEVPCQRILCVVEISPYGTRGPNAELREKGIVRGMRIITIQDPTTLQWVTFKPSNKNALTVLQKALCRAVMEKLELKPLKPKHTVIVPKDVLLGAE